jgi:tetratricopeptide (TPR) repeat protein
MADLQEESTKLERCAMDNDMLVDSVMILVGRIYEDILMDPGKAYEYYFKSCKHFNAYVYFRKGTYWKNYKKYYDRAIMDYKKSIAYFPEYYRAWFNLAQAYLADNNYDEALNAFSKVVIILYERFKSNVLRTLEIDYLFKAYSCMAYIYHASGDDYEAIRSYMRAERVWEKIDKSEFWENLNSDIYNGRNEEKKIECTNVHEKMKKQTKEKLDITNIYLNICDLSHQIKDEDLFTEYQNKLKLEEQR